MKRLILMGPIGCGKSTMIRNALGQDLSRAGGFLTVRITDGPKLLGFDLASPGAPQQGHRFLDFENGVTKNEAVFSTHGMQHLRQAVPFAVADEFGGIDLLVDDFYAQLLVFLRSEVPCIGVLKTEESAAAMAEKTPLGALYSQRYQALLQMLQSDPDTLLLPTTGWQDIAAAEQIARWVHHHVRR